MLTTKFCCTVLWEYKLFVILSNDEFLCREHDKMIFLCHSFLSCSLTAHPSAFTSFFRNNKKEYLVLYSCVTLIWGIIFALKKCSFTL